MDSTKLSSEKSGFPEALRALIHSNYAFLELTSDTYS
jgi:hypothetical protein